VWGTKTEKKRGGGTLLANEGLNFRSNNRTRRPGAACKLHHHYHRHHYSLYFESGWISTRERTQGRMSIWKTNSKLTTKQKLRERERNRKALRDNPETTGAIGEAVRLWKNPKVNPPPLLHRPYQPSWVLDPDLINNTRGEWRARTFLNASWSIRSTLNRSSCCTIHLV
jgi:hypothetical protein